MMVDADALRDSHGRLPAALRSRSAILIVVDQNGVVLLWNEAAELAFGPQEDAIVGQPFIRCGMRWDWDRIERLTPGGLSLRPMCVVQAFIRPDGSAGVIALQVKPRFDAAGNLIGCLWTGCDPGPVAAGPIPPPRHDQRPPRAYRTPAPEIATAAQLRDLARQYPLHAGFLDGHLMSLGEDPAQWRPLQAQETRLDEDGWEVCFTVVRIHPGDGMMRRRILVAAGELVSISEG
jgi:PAS domain S-box-containing protein